jgi:hypothetical protein
MWLGVDTTVRECVEFAGLDARPRSERLLAIRVAPPDAENGREADRRS